MFVFGQFAPRRTDRGHCVTTAYVIRSGRRSVAHLLSIAARLEAILVKNQVKDLPILIANAR